MNLTRHEMHAHRDSSHRLKSEAGTTVMKRTSHGV